MEKKKIDYGFQVVKDNYQDLFTDTFINKGIKYIEKYLEAIKN